MVQTRTMSQAATPSTAEEGRWEASSESAARDLGQRQATIGGYRLADWLAERLGG